ncbi:MAG: endo-1,3-alpha-glucanase family glycosylhydrolase [Elusimicrobiota bacterium]
MRRLLPAMAALMFLVSSGYAEKAKPPVIVAHYMLWYQTPDYSGSWGHWQVNRGDISRRYWHYPDQKNAQGFRDISSVYYPVIGPYDSADPDLCEYHILLARIAGIDGFVCDWYGPGHVYDDISFKALLKKAEELGIFQVGVCFEDQILFPGYAADVAARSEAVELGKKYMEYLEKEYFSSKAYIKWNGNPLITNFAWGSPGDSVKDTWLNAYEWEAVLSSLKKSPVFIHDWHSHYWRKDNFEKYDSIVPWGDCFHSNVNALPEYWKLADGLVGKGRFSFISGSVMAGFDNRGCGGWGSGSAIGITRRDNETKLRATWEDLIQNDVRFIQIPTWNDFNEGASVEPVFPGICDDDNPAEGYGYGSLEIIQEYASKLKGTRTDKKALRLPAYIYSLRKTLKNVYGSAAGAEYAVQSGKLDSARKLLLNGETDKAEAVLLEMYGKFLKNPKFDPSAAVYSEKDAPAEKKNYWGLFDYWGIQACDAVTGPKFQVSYDDCGYFPNPGRKNILLVRPMSKDMPVTLNRLVSVPGKGAKLKFSVSADAARPGQSGFLLSVSVDGSEIKREQVGSGEALSAANWHDYEFDLAGRSGRPASIEIRFYADSAYGWDASYAFVSGLKIEGVDREPVYDKIRFGGWARKWSIAGNSDTVPPEFRISYSGRDDKPYEGKKDILLVFPKSVKNPVSITRDAWIPEKGTILHFSVSPNAAKQGTAGFNFKVKVNGKNAFDGDFKAAEMDDWKNISVDLKKYAGGSARIEMIAGAVGPELTLAGHCFLSDVYLEDIDPDFAYTENMQLKGWALGWAIKDCDPDKGPVMVSDFRWEIDFPHPGKNNILCLHPLSKDQPCVMSRTVRVSKAGGRLALALSANAGRPDFADFVFKIKINGRTVFKDVISAGREVSAGGWRDIGIDLKPYANKVINIEFEAAAGGKHEWHWEHCYMADVVLSGTKDAAAKKNIKGTGSEAALFNDDEKDWARNWTVENSGKDVKFKETFEGEEDYPHPGRKWILALHPKEKDAPCVLSRAVRVPARGAYLKFSVSADAARPGIADFALAVRVNGSEKISELISAGTRESGKGWKDFAIDLKEYAGKEVKIEIENAAGGANEWGWEYCFISGLAFSSRR